jgi:hypothetical protein
MQPKKLESFQHQRRKKPLHFFKDCIKISNFFKQGNAPHHEDARNGSSESGSGRYLRSKCPELPMQRSNKARPRAKQLDMKKRRGGRTTHLGSETTQLDSGEGNRCSAQTTGQGTTNQNAGPVVLYSSSPLSDASSRTHGRHQSRRTRSDDRRQGEDVFLSLAPADSSGFLGGKPPSFFFFLQMNQSLRRGREWGEREETRERRRRENPGRGARKMKTRKEINGLGWGGWR